MLLQVLQSGPSQAWNGPTLAVHDLLRPDIDPHTHSKGLPDLRHGFSDPARVVSGFYGRPAGGREWPVACIGGPLVVTGYPVTDRRGPLVVIEGYLTDTADPLTDIRGPLTDDVNDQ